MPLLIKQTDMSYQLIITFGQRQRAKAVFGVKAIPYQRNLRFLARIALPPISGYDVGYRGHAIRMFEQIAFEQPVVQPRPFPRPARISDNRIPKIGDPFQVPMAPLENCRSKVSSNGRRRGEKRGDRLCGNQLFSGR